MLEEAIAEQTLANMPYWPGSAERLLLRLNQRIQQMIVTLGQVGEQVGEQVEVGGCSFVGCADAA